MTQDTALSILKTGTNVFLTGEPGSGKTYTINSYVSYLREHGIKAAITASTGIAATHIGGMTIHSWSGIGIRTELSMSEAKNIARVASKRIKKAAVLIIDEVSMLEGGTLELVDMVCRVARSSEMPFGGMQVVMVGDFFQLPPISRYGESRAKFAFESDAWELADLSVCYLTEQYRQSDAKFSDILSAIRSGTVSAEHRRDLDSRLTDTASLVAKKNFTKLFPHNRNVDHENSLELDKLSGEVNVFSMSSYGRDMLVEQLKRGCLSPERLELKKGAVVMFTKNNFDAGFVNGTLGVVAGFYGDNNYPIIQTGRGGRKIYAEPMEWSVGEDGEVVAGVKQIPIRLAWGITVHKSQGITLESAFMDLSEVFVEGQGYVALSRLKTLDGLFLGGYNEKALKVHPAVIEKDNFFRDRSLTTESRHNKLSEEEVSQRHENFIFVSDGQFSSSKIESSKKTDKTYSVDAIKEKHPKAYQSWGRDEEALLTDYFKSEKSIKEIAILLERKSGAIRSRLKKMGLIKA
jgi:ATP-dependent DNA helicase PIF1